MRPILFCNNSKTKLKQTNLKLEKDIQTIVQENMKEIFNIDFIKSEHSFKSGDDSGRIDSLGIDDSKRPVIFEYKLKESENVINQALFYKNWLNDHKAEFEMLVQDKFGKEERENIEWVPRAICIASNFNKYDINAVKQMKTDITLVQYYVYGDNNEFIAFEIVYNFKEDNSSSKNGDNLEKQEFKKDKKQTNKINDNSDYQVVYENQSDEKKKIIDDISMDIANLGEDVSETTLKKYKAFKKISNFATIVLKSTSVCYIFISLDYNKETMGKYENILDYSTKNHWGTGNTRIAINSKEEFDEVFHFIQQAYNEN